MNQRIKTEPLVVEPDGNALWQVKKGEDVVKSGMDNEAAWKLHDRLAGDDLSPSERRSDYGWRKYASGE